MHVYAASTCANMELNNFESCLLTAWLKATEINGTYPLELVVTGAINTVAERCCPAAWFEPFSTLIFLCCSGVVWSHCWWLGFCSLSGESGQKHQVHCLFWWARFAHGAKQRITSQLCSIWKYFKVDLPSYQHHCNLLHTPYQSTLGISSYAHSGYSWKNTFQVILSNTSFLFEL